MITPTDAQIADGIKQFVNDGCGWHVRDANVNRQREFPYATLLFVDSRANGSPVIGDNAKIDKRVYSDQHRVYSLQFMGAGSVDAAETFKLYADSPTRRPSPDVFDYSRCGPVQRLDLIESDQFVERAIMRFEARVVRYNVDDTHDVAKANIEINLGDTTDIAVAMTESQMEVSNGN